MFQQPTSTMLLEGDATRQLHRPTCHGHAIVRHWLSADRGCSPLVPLSLCQPARAMPVNHPCFCLTQNTSLPQSSAYAGDAVHRPPDIAWQAWQLACHVGAQIRCSAPNTPKPSRDRQGVAKRPTTAKHCPSCVQPLLKSQPCDGSWLSCGR